MSSFIQARLAQEALKALQKTNSTISPRSLILPTGDSQEQSPTVSQTPTPTISNLPSPSISPSLSQIQKLKKSSLRVNTPAQKLHKNIEYINEQIDVLPYEECKIQIVPQSQKPISKVRQLLICPTDELFMLESQLQAFTENDLNLNVLLKNNTDQIRTVQIIAYLQL
jgi:hypothetical protein